MTDAELDKLTIIGSKGSAELKLLTLTDLKQLESRLYKKASFLRQQEPKKGTVQAKHDAEIATWRWEKVHAHLKHRMGV